MHDEHSAAASDPLAAVEDHMVDTLGETSGRASVTFLGTERIEVLRFGPGSPTGTDPELVRYGTLGLSRNPMSDPTAALADPVRGPRAELLLSLRGGRDEVLRPLAVLAASPEVEGVVIAPGASLDVGDPLWSQARFSAVLVGEPGGLVPDLPLPEPAEPVRFLPLFPMTANEAAYKRVHGPETLQDLWLERETDVRDPNRGSAV